VFRFTRIGFVDDQNIEKILAAIPLIELGQPIICISFPAGPDTASPPTIGLTAAMGALVRRSASRIPGTARIGPMLVTGLLGAKIMASA
jgi:hypothetical protein